MSDNQDAVTIPVEVEAGQSLKDLRQDVRGLGSDASDAAARTGSLSREMDAMRKQATGSADSIREENKLLDMMGDKYRTLNGELGRANSLTGELWRGFNNWSNIGMYGLGAKVGGWGMGQVGIPGAGLMSTAGGFALRAALPLAVAGIATSAADRVRQNDLSFTAGAADLGMSTRALKVLSETAQTTRAPIEAYLELMNELDAKVAGMGRDFGLATDEGRKFARALSALGVRNPSDNSQLLLSQVFNAVQASSDNPETQAAHLRAIFGPGRVAMAQAAMETNYSSAMRGAMGIKADTITPSGQSLAEMLERNNNVIRGAKEDFADLRTAVRVGVEQTGRSLLARVMEPFFARPVGQKEAEAMAARARREDVYQYGEERVRRMEQAGPLERALSFDSSSRADRYDPATYRRGGTIGWYVSEARKRGLRMSSLDDEAVAALGEDRELSWLRHVPFVRQYEAGDLFSKQEQEGLGGLAAWLAAPFASRGPVPLWERGNPLSLQTRFGREPNQIGWYNPRHAVIPLGATGWRTKETEQPPAAAPAPVMETGVWATIDHSLAGVVRGAVGAVPGAVRDVFGTAPPAVPVPVRPGATYQAPALAPPRTPTPYYMGELYHEQQASVLRGETGLQLELQKRQTQYQEEYARMVERHRQATEIYQIPAIGKFGEPGHVPARWTTPQAEGAVPFEPYAVPMQAGLRTDAKVLQYALDRTAQIRTEENLLPEQRSRLMAMATATSPLARLRIEREYEQGNIEAYIRQERAATRPEFWTPAYEADLRRRRGLLADQPMIQYRRQQQVAQLSAVSEFQMGMTRTASQPGHELELANDLYREQLRLVEQIAKVTGDHDNEALDKTRLRFNLIQQHAAIRRQQQEKDYAWEDEQEQKILAHRQRMVELTNETRNPAYNIDTQRATALEAIEGDVRRTRERGRETPQTLRDAWSARQDVRRTYEEQRAQLAAQEREQRRTIQLGREQSADSLRIRELEALSDPSRSARTGIEIRQIELAGAGRYRRAYPGDMAGYLGRMAQIDQNSAERAAARELDLKVSAKSLDDFRFRAEEQHRLRMMELSGKQLDLHERAYQSSIRLAEKEYKDTGDVSKLRQQMFDASYQREEAAARIQRERVDQAKATAGQVWDAMRYGGQDFLGRPTWGGVRGLGGFLRGQTEVIGRSAFANVTGELMRNPVGNLLRRFETTSDEQGGERLNLVGRLFQGTMLGVTPRPAPRETDEQRERRIAAATERAEMDRLAGEWTGSYKPWVTSRQDKLPGERSFAEFGDVLRRIAPPLDLWQEEWNQRPGEALPKIPEGTVYGPDAIFAPLPTVVERNTSELGRNTAAIEANTAALGGQQAFVAPWQGPQVTPSREVGPTAPAVTTPGLTPEPEGPTQYPTQYPSLSPMPKLKPGERYLKPGEQPKAGGAAFFTPYYPEAPQVYDYTAGASYAGAAAPVAYRMATPETPSLQDLYNLPTAERAPLLPEMQPGPPTVEDLWNLPAAERAPLLPPFPKWNTGRPGAPRYSAVGTARNVAGALHGSVSSGVNILNDLLGRKYAGIVNAQGMAVSRETQHRLATYGAALRDNLPSPLILSQEELDLAEQSIAMPGGGSTTAAQQAITNERILTLQKTAGIGLAAAGAGFGAYEGIKQGGVKGGLVAGGSIVGGAGAILSMVPGGAAVGVPLMVAGLALGTGGGLLGDPKMKYAEEKRKALRRMYHMDPPPINTILGMGNSELFFDWQGGIFSSPREQRVLETHRATDNDPFFWERWVAPGTQPAKGATITAQSLGPAPVTPPASSQPSWTIENLNVHAFDSRSIVDRAGEFTDLVRTAMLNSHPILKDIKRIANT